MTAWSVQVEQTSAILASAGQAYDQLAEQFAGSAAVGGGSGVASWDQRVETLAGCSGSDGIVAGAFTTLVNNQIPAMSDALNRVGIVITATHDAAQHLVWGDEEMARAVVADEQAALNGPR